jgi:ribonucleoside-diphosphate reductase alpha chain
MKKSQALVHKLRKSSSSGWTWKQDISRRIYESKYGLRGEGIEQAFAEIASVISAPERNRRKRETVATEFHDLMMHNRFIPAGRILANARIHSSVRNFSNCFTIPITDSLDDIYDAVKNDALISKSGGGVGMDISSLRPKGAPLASGGASSGAVSFLFVFDASGKIIQTGGGRRSARIALMDVSHPDIEEFITVKQGDRNKALTGFNISVKITDRFLEAVRKDADWDLTFKGRVYKTIRAADLFEKLMKNAYEHNEPGVLFSDTVERFNNGHAMGLRMNCVNPCGELVMPSEFSLCCLGHVMLPSYVRNPFSDKADFDFAAMERDIPWMVRFLDNVLDSQTYPLPQIRRTSLDWRRIGLGFTGLADSFAMLGLTYGSAPSRYLAERIGRSLRDSSYSASVGLAKEKGRFPKCDRPKLLKSHFIATLPKHLRHEIAKNGLRNIGLNTVAPTGTTSLSVGNNCSSGIEPIISLEYKRKVRTGEGDATTTETVYNRAWLLYRESPHYEDGVIPDIFKATVESGTIGVLDEIGLQAGIQKYVDHSISKTINLPEGTSYDQYRKLFLTAWEKGLKGFTSFNKSGSMAGIFETGKKQEIPDSERLAPRRPKELACDIHEVVSGGRNFLVLIGLHEGRPYEVFAADNTKKRIDTGHHKKGVIVKTSKRKYDLIVESASGNGEKTVIEDITATFTNSDYNTLTRFLSMSLRHRVPLQFVADQLTKDAHFVSFERGVSRVLKKYIAEGEKALGGKECPQCKSKKLVYREGCLTCAECHYSKCG